jgi:hypothetical protein
VKFRLTFEGEIRPRSNARLEHIHSIRQQLHPQLKRLWDHPPLSDIKDRWLKDKSDDAVTSAAIPMKPT